MTNDTMNMNSSGDFVKNQLHDQSENDVIDVDIEDKEKRLDSISDKVELRYYGFPRSVWIGTYVGSIVFFICNNIFTVLMLGFITYPVIGIIPLFFDIFFIIPAFFIARKGLEATYNPNIPEPPGSWNVYWLVFYSFLFYQGLLWSLDSYIKMMALLEPVCEHVDGQSTEAYNQSCSWAHHPGEFYLHALTGPAVLLTASFNFFKFSRGLVFPIEFHRWVGRIHNVILVIATIGAISLAIVSSTPGWIKAGFYLLVCFWFPTMAMGWYHIRIRKDIDLHKRWMIRNYALTVCAITLRLYNLLSLGNTPYYLMVYLSLIHPVIVEGYLQYTNDCDIIWWKNIFGIK